MVLKTKINVEHNISELSDLLEYLKDLTDELEEGLQELASFELNVNVDIPIQEGGDEVSE